MPAPQVQHYHLSRPRPGVVRLTLQVGAFGPKVFDFADQPRLAAAFLKNIGLCPSPPFKVTADWAFDPGPARTAFNQRTVFGQLCRALDARPREGRS